MDDGDASLAASGPDGQPNPDPGAAPRQWPAREEGVTLTSELVRRLDQEQDDASTAPTVTAEWALWGKDADRTSYHVLRCSAGAFSLDDFREIITRYASGVKQELPQYTVCWIPATQEHPTYVGVAIHELADRDPSRSGGRIRTAGGREIEYVRLFCVRYSELAEAGVSYTDLFDTVQGYLLDHGNSSPISVPLRSGAGLDLGDKVRLQAEHVVGLLLTTQPVCVLGAEGTTAAERLAFIELVMSLLPYGLRARLSASTWASSTAQDLKLRLYFANARRDGSDKTSYVTWGAVEPASWLEQPGQPGEYDTIRMYLRWLLRVGSEAAPALVGETTPLRFAHDDIRQMVGSLPKDPSVLETLEGLAGSLQRGDVAAIRAAVDRLRRYLHSRSRPVDRVACRQVIFRRGLLRSHPGLNPRTESSVYRVLLQLAFDEPMTYGSYCEIEHAIGGPPRGRLRLVLVSWRFATFIPMILAAKGEPGFTDQELSTVLDPRRFSPTAPIDEVAELGDGIRPEHRAIVYDFAMAHLWAYAEDPWRELRLRGYLAETLDVLFPGNLKAQAVRLDRILRYGYGSQLSKAQIDDLFEIAYLHPTAALEVVARKLSASPRSDREIARQAALARLSSAGYAEDALLLVQTAQDRRAPLRERASLIPKTTIYTGIVVFLALCFVIYLVITAAH